MGWLFCDGQLLPIAENETLFQLIGTTYGGDGQRTFALPDLRGRVPVHQGNGGNLAETGGTETVTLTVNQIPSHTHPFLAVGSARGDQISPAGNVPAQSYNVVPFINDQTIGNFNAGAITPSGGSQPHENLQPYLSISFIISLFGHLPQPDLVAGASMADPFVAEIRIFPFNFAPKGWAWCDGQLMPISQNTALFSLLGTFYGGDGKSNFGLPNLQGSAPLQHGQGPGLSRLRPRPAGRQRDGDAARERDAVAPPRAAREHRRRRRHEHPEPDRGLRPVIRRDALPGRRERRSSRRRRWRPPAATGRTTTCSRTSRSTSTSRCRVSSRPAPDVTLRPVGAGDEPFLLRRLRRHARRGARRRSPGPTSRRRRSWRSSSRPRPRTTRSTTTG